MRQLLLLLIASVSGFLTAQSYAFLQWTVADGLPANEVTTLAQDDKGYLWVGTNGGGAARFDGKEFESFSTADGLTDNFVRSVVTDSRGIVVRTNTGSLRFVAAEKKFLGAAAGAQKAEEAERAAPPNIRLRGGKLLAVNAKLTLRKGMTLVGNNDGLYLLSNNGEILRHFTAPSNLPGTRVRALLKDRQNRVWIGTDGGLARMIPSGIRHFPPGENGPAGRRITAILVGYGGDIWLGLGQDGLQRYDSSGFHPPISELLLPKTELTSINEVPGYGLFMTTANRGMYVLNDSLEASRLTMRDGLPDNRLLTSLPSFDEVLWATSYDQGLCLVRPIDSTFQVQSFGPDEGIPLTNFTAAIWGSSGSILLADKLGNIYRWNSEAYTMVATYGAAEGLPRAPITAMSVRSGTQLWVAVAGHGLYFTDLTMESVRFAPLPARFGAMPTDINVILTPKTPYDKERRNKAEVWLGTDRNLIRIYLDRNGRPDWFRTYGKAEGFPLAQTLTADESEDGQLWFGTNKGLVSITPDDADGYLAPPPTTLESIGLFYNPLTDQDYTLENGKPLFTAANNHLNFNFRAVDLTYPERLQYQWRLQGAEKEWSPVTDATTVRYARLPSGSYVFMARATTDGGKTWGKAIEYPFVIGSPLWRTPWFVGLLTLLVIMLFIGGFYAFYQRLQRAEARKREALEAENQLLTLEQKALQLQMNPHFIFNALNGIRGLVDGKNDAEARLQIGRFAKLMRGILNNSRRETIPLSEEINTLTEYLEMERFCQPFGFTYTISPPENVDPEEVNMPSMLLQPFLENAVLHGLSSLKGRTGHINVSFIMRGRRMQCTVSDNGIGRSAAAQQKASRPSAHKSVALDVTRARLKTMKGRMEVIDVLDADGEVAGTQVILFFPVESW